MKAFHLPESITRGFGKIKLTGKKYSPEILIALGIVTGVGCVITTAISAVKVSKKLDETKQLLADAEEGAKEEALEEVTNDIKIDAAKEIGKEVLIPAALGIASVACTLGGFGIMRNRAISYAAAYEAVNQSLKHYRESVREQLGEETEKKIYDDLCAKDGVEKSKTEEKPSYCPYSRYWNDSKEFSDDRIYDTQFIASAEAIADATLKRDGYIFLNDIYKMLGFKPSLDGQFIGWYYNPKYPIGDNCVKFNVTNTNLFDKNGRSKIRIDFNCDGDIMKYAFDN